MTFEKKPAGKGPQKRSSRAKQPAPQPAKPLLSTDQWIDLIGYTLIALAALTILSALSPGGQGDLTSGWLNILKRSFGWGVVVAPAIMGLIGIYLVLRRFGDRFPRLAPGRIAGLTVAYLAALGTLQLIGMASEQSAQALVDEGAGGGLVGLGLINALNGAVGTAGAVIVLFVLWLIAFMLTASLSVAQIVDAVQRHVAARQTGATEDVIVPSWDRERNRGHADDLVI
ncbi:MAG: DNA translocase FtsK 4TM domain-containing protein, partial [Chloroflexi bacterium]|nr:DNA translocase FtsK 4TM domain-containing protein [Chloroflexota bacterium]